MAREIVMIIILILKGRIRWIEPQVCWWSSQLEVCLDFINRDIIPFYWTPIQVGIVILVLKFKIVTIMKYLRKTHNLPYLVYILDD